MAARKLTKSPEGEVVTFSTKRGKPDTCSETCGGICDYCQKQLPDDYATTNGEGKGYYVKKAHDTIPLDTPIAECTGIVVEVTLGTPKDDHHFTDLCDDCRLKFLKMAVEHLERKVAAEKEGLNNDGEETDV